MKNFNKMSRGEQAYAMNEVISSLNDERAYYSDWLNFWPDEATLEEAKEDFDDCSDEDWKVFVRLFRIRIEMFGCEDGRSIQEDDVDGLRVPNIKNPEYEEKERGGGFYFCLNEKDDSETMARVARVRETLSAFGYPLTDNATNCGHASQGVVFYVDWRKWRAQKASAFIKESVEWLLSQECGCCTARLTAVTQLAVGWMNGFDPEDPSVIHSKSEPTWGICVGIKSIDGDDMKTDFEWLTTPYAADGDNEGEVFSNLEAPLSPKDDYEKAFEYLVGEYRSLLKEYKVHRDGKCFHKTL